MTQESSDWSSPSDPYAPPTANPVTERYVPEALDKEMKSGAYFAWFVAGITSLAAFFLGDMWLFLDVAIAAVLGLFIWKRSRVAIVLFIAYYILSKIIAIASGMVGAFNVVVPVLITIGLVKSAKAIFTYHREYK